MAKTDESKVPAKPLGIGNKYIRFAVSEGGEIETKPVGFSDGTCLNATKAYEDAIGGTVDRKFTGPDCGPVTVKVSK